MIAMLAESLVKLGHQVTVYTTNINGKSRLDVKTGVETGVDGASVFYFESSVGDPIHISLPLWRKLNATVKDYDIVHIHSWWNFLVIGAAWICSGKRIMPVISPHGMFSDYILETNNSKKKRIIQNVIGKKLLGGSWLHVSTQMEAEESEKIIPGWRHSIIPNLVKLSEKVYERGINERFTIGFLSRVDPKKGLDILIKALSKVSFDYELHIAGSGDEDYIRFLKSVSHECGNTAKIKWLGWKSSEDKFDYLSKIDLFALTSHSENFAIVIIEALSMGTPVIISENVGLHNYVTENNFGWTTDLEPEHIAMVLNEAFMDKKKTAGDQFSGAFIYKRCLQ